MKKLLVTGFDPFGGESVNAAWEAVSKLPEQIGEYQIFKRQIPTVFGLAARKTELFAGEIQPDVILCIGQAAGRCGVTPEVIGINLQEARIPDNAGNQPVNCPIVSDGPAAYFSTIPVREVVAAIQKEDIPASLSYSAGTFVCNDVLYSLLHRYRDTNTLIGFIHLPCLPEQAKPGQPSMALDNCVRALTAAIAAL